MSLSDCLWGIFIQKNLDIDWQDKWNIQYCHNLHLLFVFNGKVNNRILEKNTTDNVRMVLLALQVTLFSVTWPRSCVTAGRRNSRVIHPTFEASSASPIQREFGAKTLTAFWVHVIFARWVTYCLFSTFAVGIAIQNAKFGYWATFKWCFALHWVLTFLANLKRLCRDTF